MNLRILEEAEAEIRQAMLWYEDRQPGLGQDFHDNIANAIRSIDEDPVRHPLYEGKTTAREYRRTLVERFPYVVIFEVREAETIIVAVAHGRQRAGYWRNR